MKGVFSESGSTGWRRIGMIAAAGSIAVAGSTGCKTFDVNVQTDDPLKVELKVEVHLIQRDPGDDDAAEAVVSRSLEDAEKGRIDRQEEIQKLKDSRIIGENREWLLEVRNLPGGDWGKRVREVLKAENLDRNLIIEHQAARKGIPPDEGRDAKWKEAIRKSFPGEWIEVETETKGEYQWINKGQASEGEESAEKSADSGDAEEN